MVRHCIERMPEPPIEREVTESPWGKHILSSIAELEKDPWFKDMRRLGERYNFEYKHSAQVCRLSLALFDDLERYHKLGERDRTLMLAASFLHDIGAFGEDSEPARERARSHGIHDYKHHHKRSQKIILEEGVPDLTGLENRIVSCVARYHTKDLPRKKDKVYKDLSAGDQKKVRTMSALLRIADSLDRRHASMAKDLKCHLSADGRTLSIWLFCKEHDFDWRPKHRTDLFEKEFVVKVRIPVLFGVRVG